MGSAAISSGHQEYESSARYDYLASTRLPFGVSGGPFGRLTGAAFQRVNSIAQPGDLLSEGQDQSSGAGVGHMSAVSVGLSVRIAVFARQRQSL